MSRPKSFDAQLRAAFEAGAAAGRSRDPMNGLPLGPATIERAFQAFRASLGPLPDPEPIVVPTEAELSQDEDRPRTMIDRRGPFGPRGW